MQWPDLFGSRPSAEESPVTEDAAVAQIRQQQGVQELAHALKSDSILVRVAAAQTLGMVGSTTAVGPLSEAMKDVWRAVRIVAGESLAKIATGGGFAPYDIGELSATDRDARAAITSNFGPAVLFQYIQALGNADRTIRLAAVEVLGETRAVEAVAPLIRALKDDAAEVVSEANEALVRLGDIALPGLQQSARDRDPRVRESVAWCLGEIARYRS